MTETVPDYDAFLLVSFGGPEGPDDVLPFLENVLRGKDVPRERMLEVADHYQQFGGVSPINQQCRDLISALTAEFSNNNLDMPIYWGNRNWHPMLADTLREMRNDGLQRALAFMTSAFSSYSGCRQYLEDIAQARNEVGDGAPQIDKLRVFFNHPGFIDSMQEQVQAAIDIVPAERRASTQIVFSAHSIPEAMAGGCAYEAQLNEACKLVSEAFADQSWKLVYQSRSGPPTQRWLEPDVCDYLRELPEAGAVTDVVIAPIGFVSDHVEVVFDLDTEAREVSEELGLNMIRAATVGTHPKFISMIRELVLERATGGDKPYLGVMGPSHDVCPADCCPSGRPSGPTTGRRPA